MAKLWGSWVFGVGWIQIQKPEETSTVDTEPGEEVDYNKPRMECRIND